MGTTKLLYVSPERLGSELFQTKLRHMRVSFITVDEAHCISQWGYDFRPSYLKIADIRRICPNVPVLALTATATPKVVDDICGKLNSFNFLPRLPHVVRAQEPHLPRQPCCRQADGVDSAAGWLSRARLLSMSEVDATLAK